MLVPPPQPMSVSDAIASTRKATIRCLFLSVPTNNIPNTGIANTKPGLRALARLLGVVVMVSVEVAPCDEGVTEAGLKPHVAPTGRPEQVSTTALLNPDAVLMVTTTLADCPAFTVAVSTDNSGEKSGGTTALVKLTVWLLPLSVTGALAGVNV